jgi:hypothetical protein
VVGNEPSGSVKREDCYLFKKDFDPWSYVLGSCIFTNKSLIKSGTT